MSAAETTFCCYICEEDTAWGDVGSVVRFNFGEFPICKGCST